MSETAPSKPSNSVSPESTSRPESANKGEPPKTDTKEAASKSPTPNTPKSPTPNSQKSPTPNAQKSPTPTTPKPDLPKTNEKENKTPASNTEPKANGNDGGAKGPTLREQFRAFSKFGDTKSDGKLLTLSQSDKWMKQAKVIDGKTITTTDTAIHFKKFKQMKISFPDYEKYVADLAKAKSIEEKTIKDKLKGCGAPGTTGTTAVLKNQAVDRLTDTTKFTGSHKIRVESSKTKNGTPSPRK